MIFGFVRHMNVLYPIHWFALIYALFRSIICSIQHIRLSMHYTRRLHKYDTFFWNGSSWNRTGGNGRKNEWIGDFVYSVWNGDGTRRNQIMYYPSYNICFSYNEVNVIFISKITSFVNINSLNFSILMNNNSVE